MHPTGLTAIVPCYDEGGQVEIAHRAICDALGGSVLHLEVLFIDDGSSDDTLARIKALAAADPRVHYLAFTRNFGLAAATTAGLRYASQPWTVQIDADLQFPPAQTWKLLEAAATGHDVVFGIRLNRKDSRLRRLGTAGTHWLATRLLGIEIPRGASSFYLARTAVGRTIVNLPTGNSQLIAKVPQVGARYAGVPIDHEPRTTGPSRFRVGVLGGYAFELLFGFSWRPLNATYLAAALTVMSGLTVAALGAFGVLPATAVAIAGLLGSVVAVGAVAVVGRYLHRRMMDVPPRRLYYVRESDLRVHPDDLIDRGEPFVAPPGRIGALDGVR